MTLERLYLTGFMAAGKSAVGLRLAELLDWQFVDLDREIEGAAGASVAEILAGDGERRFRQLESRALAATRSRSRLVVATGGGALLSRAARELVRPDALLVWLKPPFDELVVRIEAAGADRRPLYRDRASARRLYRRRLPAYRQADLVLEPDPAESIEQTAERLLALVVAAVGEAACAT